ncbi:MAG: hypothetical protein WCJ19_04970 [bacterium]
MSKSFNYKKWMPAIIAFGLAIVLAIGITIFYFVNNKASSENTPKQISNNVQGGKSVSGRGARGRLGGPGGIGDLSQICEKEKNTPSNIPSRTGVPQNNFNEFQNKVTEVCADGVLTDSEKQELQDLLKNIQPPSRDNFQP